jgi:hypothetical protein
MNWVGFTASNGHAAAPNYRFNRFSPNWELR